MATITFSLSAKKRKDKGDSEVLLRLSVGRGNVFRAKSNFFILVKNWNSSKGKIIIPRLHVKEQKELLLLQGRLDSMRTFILDRALSISPSLINKKWLDGVIYEFHFGTSKAEEIQTQAFFEVFHIYVKSQIKPGNRTVQFNCLKRMLKRYELYRGEGYELKLDNITDIDLCEFEDFLQIEHSFFDKDGKCVKYTNVYKMYPESRIPKRRGINGIHYIMKRFRTFYNWAVDTGRTTNNPFRKFHLQSCVYGTPFFITIDERNKLYSFDLSDVSQLAIQRDIFVFQSCIGIRPNDYQQLTRANIIGDAVEYIPSKTLEECGDTVRVPLCSQAKEILNRYEDKQCKELFPFISMQHYNQAIKKVLELAGINRIVTILNPITRKEEQYPIFMVASAYMARRNFIGNLYKKVKDPNIIGSMTGHAEGSKAFARYRTIDDEVKKSVISELE